MWPFKSKPKPPLCKDCKYMACMNVGYRFARCSLFIDKEDDDLVGGEVKNIYCSDARIWKCGRKGKYFEPKVEV